MKNIVKAAAGVLVIACLHFGVQAQPGGDRMSMKERAAVEKVLKAETRRGMEKAEARADKKAAKTSPGKTGSSESSSDSVDPCTINKNLPECKNATIDGR